MDDSGGCVLFAEVTHDTLALVRTEHGSHSTAVHVALALGQACV